MIDKDMERRIADLEMAIMHLCLMVDGNNNGDNCTRAGKAIRRIRVRVTLCEHVEEMTDDVHD